MNPEEFGERLLSLLPRLMQEILQYENNYVTTGKITCQQFLVLEAISQKKQWRMKELAEALKISFSTATGMVDRLIKQGLLKRAAGNEDRRTVFVSLTAKGRQIVEEVCIQKKEGIIQVFGRLTASERRQYLDIIEKLTQNLSRTKGE